MKKLCTLFVITALTISVFAQAPQKLSYQFVVRNATGGLVTNSPVGVRIAILQGSATGTIVYQELFNPNPQTNTNGLVSLEIGTGLPITGTFSGINWSAGPYFLKTETDPAGGTNYTVVGTSELLSVPYALYASLAQEPMNNSVTSAKIADGSIVTADLANGTVTSAKIADGNVSTADLANSAVTTAKISSTGAAANEVLQYTGSSITWDYAPGSLINYTFLNGPCATLNSFTSTFQKVGDIGSVSKLSAYSKLEVTYYGRVKVTSVTSTGGYFELRVDNMATTNGRANVNFRPDIADNAGGENVCITGVFTGLGAGTHTISMWVRAQGTGTGTYAAINPGCWAGDYVIVKEIR